MSATQWPVTKVKIGQTERRSLIERVQLLKGKKILIIGDVGLDEYVMGEVRRISPEAPVPILEVAKEENRLGLTANVAQNVVSLGGEAIMVSVVGQDLGGSMLEELCQQVGVKFDQVVKTESRPTTRKTRVMAGHHHLVRVDYEVRKFLSQELEDKVFAKVQQNLSKADGVIIQDYAKGVISKSLVERIVSAAHAAGKAVMLDPHRNNSAEFYKGIDLIKPNFDEAVILSGLTFDELRDHPNKVEEVGLALLKKTGAKTVVLTRGKDGMTIFSEGKIIEVPTYARKVFDVTGAGDTVIAALTLALSSGFSLTDSCMLANFAAGVVVGKIGCVPCETEELKQYIEETHE